MTGRRSFGIAALALPLWLTRLFVVAHEAAFTRAQGAGERADGHP